MSTIRISRVVLYKHGVGYFEREGTVEGDASITLAFKQAEVSDVLKTLVVLDLDGGHVDAVSYDSTKPLEQLLAEVALSIPDKNGLGGLLPQLKGARVRIKPVATEAAEGVILGLDAIKRHTPQGVVEASQLSLLGDDGQVRSFELHDLTGIQILDESVRRDLDYYLRTELSAKKKDARSFSIFARGQGCRRLRVGYTVEAPVWKATYRLMLGEEGRAPTIQGWAVVDNTQDEDWEDVTLSLVSGLPVSFVHDLYAPRYIKRPVVEVKETTGVLPPELEYGVDALMMDAESPTELALGEVLASTRSSAKPGRASRAEAVPPSAISSMPAQVRERKLGDLFEYEIEHPVTIRRNQAALVPIVLREFKGRPVLLYNKKARAENPLRCVEFENTTGLTLEGGPVAVFEEGNYVGEAMLETVKPDETRLVPFAVELSVAVLDNVDTRDEDVTRVVIRRGTFKLHYTQERRTTYAIANKAGAEYVVYLDHPRDSTNWRLGEPESPHETTESYWRFRFGVPARQETRFVVRQTRDLVHEYGLADSSSDRYETWIRRRYLDPETTGLLQRVIDLRRQAGALDERIKRLGAERQSIHSEQQRIRENLKSLGDRVTEKELRERFVRTLDTQEDRLDSIEAQIQTETDSRDRIRDQIEELLANHEYEAEIEVPPPRQRKSRDTGRDRT